MLQILEDFSSTVDQHPASAVTTGQRSIVSALHPTLTDNISGLIPGKFRLLQLGLRNFTHIAQNVSCQTPVSIDSARLF